MTTPLTLSFGSDHGGLALRRGLIEALKAKGFVVLDRGTETEASCDYPDYAHAVAADVVGGGAKFGILVCTTGIGISSNTELGADDTGYACMPLFHSNSMFVGLMPAF